MPDIRNSKLFRTCPSALWALESDVFVETRARYYRRHCYARVSAHGRITRARRWKQTDLHTMHWAFSDNGLFRY